MLGVILSIVVTVVSRHTFFQIPLHRTPPPKKKTLQPTSEPTGHQQALVVLSLHSQGYLMTQSKMLKRWTPRYFVLDNGFLSHYEKKSLVGTKKHRVCKYLREKVVFQRMFIGHFLCANVSFLVSGLQSTFSDQGFCRLEPRLRPTGG